MPSVSASTSHPGEPASWPDDWSDASRALSQYREQAERRAAHFRLLARYWNSVYYGFGLVSTALAAVSGIGFLGNLVGATVAGWLALAAAVVGALATFLAGADRRDEARQLAADWQDFADRCAASLMDLKGYLVRAAATSQESIADLVLTQRFYGYEYHHLVVLRQPERRALLARQPIPKDPEESRRPPVDRIDPPT